jgi:parallel beta-helix repeat protein
MLSCNSIGINIHYSNDNQILENVVESKWGGIKLQQSSRNLVEYNSVSNSGIHLYRDANDNTFNHNTITGDPTIFTSYGFYHYDSDGTTISDNTITVKKYGVYLIYAYDVTIKDNTISTGLNSRFPNGYDYFAIRHMYGVNSVITGNTMIRGGIYIDGQLLEHWNTHTIDTLNTINGKPLYYWKNRVGGTVPSNAGEVILANCQEVLIENMDVLDGTVGIELGFSSDNIIKGNKIQKSCYLGMFLTYSPGNEISNNDIYCFETGFSTRASTNLLVSWNKAKGYIAMSIGGGSGNSNINNNSAWGNAHGLGLTTSSNSIIKDNDFRGWTALYTSLSDDVLVDNNYISSGGFGFQPRDSNRLIVTSNDIFGGYWALTLRSSHDGYYYQNIIEGYRYTSHGYGLHLLTSTGNTFEFNTVLNSKRGVYLDSSEYNTIFHNNIIDNVLQAYDTNPVNNDWHHLDLLEGNYWSDYTGEDNGGMTYPWDTTGKHLIGGDGIGDTLVPHHTVNFDYYPLMIPYVGNEPPIADANGPYSEFEGSVITFDASGSTDPDEDSLEYRWDFDNDGSWDTGWSTNPTAPQTWNDDHSGTVKVEVTDGSLSTTAETTVTVLNANPVITSLTTPFDPTQVNALVEISATFTDAGILDTHTASIDWGDETSTSGVVTEADGSGTVTGSHSYATPGVYQVILTVTDDDGGFATITSEYVVIFDPTGAFITGGGMIDSPAGAYTADPSITGKAGFGFVSKYQKGSTTPGGNTQFRFHAADLSFKSDNYDWLVVAGSKGMFKGTGTINGAGSYKFIISAIDGDMTGGDGIDKFRIKIWEEDEQGFELVVYDNNLGGDIDADPTTGLTHGSIKIHKG